MDKKKRKTIRLVVEIILAVIALLLVAYLLHEHTPKILKILESGSVSDVESYIQDEGSKGRFFLILLQVIETVSIILPALPVYICAGAVFGKIQGFLMCYLTNVVMNVVIFECAKRMRISTDVFAKFQKNPKLEDWMARRSIWTGW